VQEKENMWFSGSLDFDGITSMGSTKEEARKNLELVISDMLLHKELSLDKVNTVDEETYIKNLYEKDIKFLLSDIDINDFLFIKDASKAERTNVSIKHGYKVLAKKHNINISQFINEKLSEKLEVKF
ncbi:MAG: hypothetical protein KAG14_03375, partial [Mycoplasmataceae bacterium]|nr:hypothetical protein [Mycoplasmataceae bacterium]